MLVIATLISLVAYTQVQTGQISLSKGVPTIVVVGDFTSDSDFGSDVLASITALQRDPDRRCPPFNIVEISDSNGSDFAAHEFIRELTRTEVAAVAIASVSSRAARILNLCKALELPTLVVVATNVRLMERSSPMVRRVVPSDAIQAQTIREWLGRNRGPSAVFYEPGVYGTDLAYGSTRELGVVLKFPLDGPISLTPLEGALDLGTRTFAFLGYSEDVSDALIKLEALCDKRKTRVNAIISDGAYRVITDLPQLDNIDLTLSYPFPLPTLRQNYYGFGSLAKESVQIMLNAWDEASSRREQLQMFDRRAAEIGMRFQGSERIDAHYNLISREPRSG